jgi:hypothetical protein
MMDAKGMMYTFSVGRFSSGEIAEVFVSNGKRDSQSDIACRDLGIICSIALQFGAPIDVLRNALSRDPRGDALGPLGQVLDYITKRK